MNKIHQYIPLHFSVFLTLGIVLGNYFKIAYVFLFIGLLITLIISFLLYNKIDSKAKVGFQIAVYLFFIVLGWQLILSQQPQYQPLHFSHFSSAGSMAKVQILETMKATTYRDKYLVQVSEIDQKVSEGKAILMVTKNDSTKKYQIGEVLLLPSVFEKIPKPFNPYTFDYAHYMAHKGVFYQAEVDTRFIKSTGIKINRLSLIGLQLRDFIQKKMQNQGFGKSEWAIINALVIGDKQFISKDLQGNYAGAGVVHILAVSGLHVGILFLILSFVFSPLKRLKNGKLYVGISIIFILWIFALVAGLSGSVVRAVTMFSFITLGTFIRNQKTPVLESVFASYFIILLIEPLFVFDVGFQLSYLAVIGIVVLQPKMMEVLPSKKPVFLYKITQLLTVSIAATLATLPLSLYYFHQFPSLFWLSNVVIIPFIGIVLGMGLLVALLAVMGILPDFIVYIYNGILSIMNQFVYWVSAKEQFLIKEIPFTFSDTLASYLVIFLLLRWLFSIKKPYVINPKFQTFLLGVIVMQLVFISEKYTQSQSKEMVVFHKNKESILGIKTRNNLEILHRNDSIHLNDYPFLSAYKMAYNIEKLNIKPLNKNVYLSKKGILLKIDSLGIYQNLSFKPDLVLLTQSPKINLDRFIREISPKYIIADGSNYPFMIAQWDKTCKSYKIPFHATREKGAFVLK